MLQIWLCKDEPTASIETISTFSMEQIYKNLILTTFCKFCSLIYSLQWYDYISIQFKCEK